MKIKKTVRQYSSRRLDKEDMEKLLAVAKDYHTVRNEVYQRYSGIGALAKLTPGYEIQNEMTKSGLREQIGCPSVYFYTAVFDALGNIRGNWGRLRKRVLSHIAQNDRFSEEERHYLRFVLKSDRMLAQVLNRENIEPEPALVERYEELRDKISIEGLHNYLCRQVRTELKKAPHTTEQFYFAATERAYRYADHGIYLSVKEKRRRVFIPLTDNNTYRCQLRVRLEPENRTVSIDVPIGVRVRQHSDYENHIGIAFGADVLFTVNNGNQYGADYGRLHREYASWLRDKNAHYAKTREQNAGRKKYMRQKNAKQEYLHSYINAEINRMLAAEKPQIVYSAKMPKPKGGGAQKETNFSLGTWERGYVRGRLRQKCEEHAVSCAEVFGGGISTECSRCGQNGQKENGYFCCSSCGYHTGACVNTAENILKRGEKNTVRVR